jgi:predicted  nucleic acid-binding Zn-ribbon protein
MSPTPTEHLATAEARHDQVHARLEAARVDLTNLGTAIDKSRDAYRDELARTELEGGTAPSRATLGDLQGQLPAAEDRVAALERALVELDRQVRHARADVLDEQAAAMRAETARRQERITELVEEIRVRQDEAYEHGNWIANEGPVKTQQLQAEAYRLRNAP